MENDIRLETRALRSSVSQGRSGHFLLFFPDPRRDQVQLTRRIPLASRLYEASRPLQQE